MNKHVQNALKTYEENNINFWKLLEWHLAFGVVLSDCDGFAMCFYSDLQDPTTACERHHADTLFVTFHCGDMEKFAGPFMREFDYIAFQREFKGSPKVRLYDLEAFHKKLKVK